MPVNLGILRGRVRSAIDEVTAKFFTDAELRDWMNDACRDIARRSESVQSFNATITVVSGTSKYTLPSDLIRIHRLEFVPAGQTQTYALEPATHAMMDNVWGVNQSASGSPRFYVSWGYPPNLQVQLYPVPSVSGVLNLYYYRLPTAMLNDSDIAEVPEGWDDAVINYCESEAKRKDHDPTWQEARGLYEQKVRDLINVTRAWHDQGSSIQMGRNYYPSWLYGGDE